MVTATQRRRAVDHLKSRRISERRACRLTGFSRSAAWRPLKGRNDARLRARLKHLAERYPKYGCPTLHDMLVIEGEVINKKRTYRIYCEEGLQVRTKKRRKITRPRVPNYPWLKYRGTVNGSDVAPGEALRNAANVIDTQVLTRNRFSLMAPNPIVCHLTGNACDASLAEQKVS